MKTKTKMHGVYLTDEEFADCSRKAGHRQFNTWARATLLERARDLPPRRGTVAGGVCAHEGCGRVPAWWYHPNPREYFCDHCALQWDEVMRRNAENRCPSSSTRGELMALVDAAVAQSQALIRFGEGLANTLLQIEEREKVQGLFQHDP